MLAFGLALALPLAILFGGGMPSGSALAWLVVAGVANAVGLLLQYAALRTGKVGVVAQICATEGAIAAVLSAIAGAHLAIGTVVAIAAITVGLVLATAHDNGGRGGEGRTWLVLAIAAALLFGLNLLALSESGRLSSAFLAVLPARIVGTVAIFAPLALHGRLVRPGRALPLVVAAGIGEVVGVLAYAAGAQTSTAVAAVIASQFGALSIVGAFLLDGERLRRRQLLGLAIVSIAVAALAAGVAT